PLDIALSDGERVTLGDTVGEIIETPGHTRGHISYFFDDGPILFCGDTLFSLGCGRLLEGTAAEMFSSLARLALLPDDTLVCCGHEYTESNARFAVSADPDRVALLDRAREVTELRAKGTPTVPVRLGLERITNPFLLASDLPAFAALRSRKDNF
ncbi:MAG: hydroxyacylglutathione hydrolase C-terminal domain-containing protein, partial [Janthinobacterium lividum]